jgi:hypothetical protein
MLMERKIGSWLQQLLIKPAGRLLRPATFIRLVRRMGLPGYDGVFLNFQKGNMGIQLVAQEFAKIFKRSTFLYDIPLSASALRGLTRGAKTPEDQELLARFVAETAGKKQQNYNRVIAAMKTSRAAGQKAFLFGAPYQLKELVSIVADAEKTLALKPGSAILFGGGWKTFEGEKIEKPALVQMIAETFGVAADHIIEGYSMTEINGVLVGCEHNRFHLPPLIEPVILDPDLNPLDGHDLKGAFGFLDPLALSYPGFIISGDNVRLLDDPCPCGLSGPALLEPTRAPGREIKGCGGIMASVQA